MNTTKAKPRRSMQRIVVPRCNPGGNPFCPECGAELHDVHQTDHGGIVVAHYYECEKCSYRESLDHEE